MRNIELKARLMDRSKALAACASIQASFQGDIRQVDTYFPVKEGRFKFRESYPGDHYLVYYNRANTDGPKGCDYKITKGDIALLDILRDALSVDVVVTKVRTLYLWNNVRIHLDRVEGLGQFIEFEAVLTGDLDDADGYRKLDHLQEVFGIHAADLLQESYRELLQASPFQA